MEGRAESLLRAARRRRSRARAPSPRATIRKGTRIIEYLGQRISWRTADKRYDDEKMGRHHTFLFTVDDKTCIDAARERQRRALPQPLVRPNCEAINDRKRIFIEARQNITAGDGAALRLPVRAHRRPHGGGREVLRVPLRLAEVPRHHPRAEVDRRADVAVRRAADPARADAPARGLRGALSARGAPDGGGGRAATRRICASPRRVDARPVRRAGRRGSTSWRRGARCRSLRDGGDAWRSAYW